MKEFKVYYQHGPGKATTPEESKITLEEMLSFYSLKYLLLLCSS